MRQTVRFFSAPSSARPLLGAAAFLLLASCATPEPDLAPVAERSMVGMTANEVMSCAGVPHRSTLTPTGFEYYTYSNEIYESTPGTSLGVGVGTTSSALSLGIGFPLDGTRGTITNQSCEVTLMLSEGIVRNVSYTSTGGVGPQRNRLCNDIVRACVQRVQPTAQISE